MWQHVPPGQEKARTRTSGFWECAGSWRFPPREKRRGLKDGREGRGRRAVGVMMMVTAAASPCARFKVSSYQHLRPERQIVIFFSSFTGVTRVTVAPLPSPSASGSARLTATPLGTQGRCRDGTRAVGVSFPPPSLPLSLSPCPGTCRGRIDREALSQIAAEWRPAKERLRCIGLIHIFF